MPDFAFWMTTPHIPHLEIAADVGFRNAVFDVEHGTFDLETLDRAIAICKGLGIKVFAKVLGPATEPVQQALDFGAEGVIIPHIGGVEQARAVCAATKYPPLGLRSASGGRCAGYKRSAPDYYEAQNARIRCWPMIETAEALADVEKIAALPTVDGLFAGPTDLSLTRGRGGYTFTDADRVDLKRIADAAKAAGKQWVFPAWTPPERAFAKEHGASLVVIASQFSVIRTGLQGAADGVKAEGFVLS